MNTASKRIEPLMIGIILTLVFIMAARAPIDSDLWWHLRAGETMLSKGQIFTTDTFSYTRQGATWIDHSWLAEIIMTLAHQWGGYFALGGLVAGSAALSMLFVYLQMKEPPLLRAFVIIWASLVAAWVWSARPQLFSLLFFSLVALILTLYKRGTHNLLWMFIPIFILWSNLHAGYTLGLLLIGCVIAGEIFNRILVYPTSTNLPWKPVRSLLIWGLISGLVALINPNGINTWLIPFQTVNVSVLQQFISEWASPDFHVFSQQVYLWLLFAVTILYGISGKKVDGAELIPFVFFGYLGLVARRNFGPFALVAAPILSRQLWGAAMDWWGRFSGKKPDLTSLISKNIVKFNDTSQKNDRVRKVVNALIIVILVAGALAKLYIVTTPELVESYVVDTFPTKAVEWIKHNRPEGPLFNSYNWGGYLDWALPDYPVFVDGRTDLFNDQILGEWIKIVNVEKGWQGILQKWNVRLILLESSQPVVEQLEINGWRPLYRDEQAVVYGK